MTYDRADWHYGGDFPSELPLEAGGTHIGMFLAWAIRKDLVGSLHLNHSAGSVQQVKDREITGRDFFFGQCDAKFWEDDLNDEGNAFAKAYYEHSYLTDYESILGGGVPTLYHVEDSWANFDKLDP